MSALQLGVVVDAQPSQVGHLFAAQTWHAPGTVALDHVEACCLWADLRPTRDQEVSNLGPAIHPSKPKRGAHGPPFWPWCGHTVLGMATTSFIAPSSRRTTARAGGPV